MVESQIPSSHCRISDMPLAFQSAATAKHLSAMFDVGLLDISAAVCARSVVPLEGLSRRWGNCVYGCRLIGGDVIRETLCLWGAVQGPSVSRTMTPIE